MAGNTNFPTGLDDDTSLYNVTDNVDSLQAAHHNNIKEAIKAIEAKVGIDHTAVDTSLDFRLGNPTGGHSHDGASGQGPILGAGAIPEIPTSIRRHIVKTFIPGSAASGANRGIPITVIDGTGPDYLILEEVVAVARRAPSGATTTIDINYNGTSIWHATQPQRLFLNPGATYRWRDTFSTATWIIGQMITVDVDSVGSSAPGEDISINFVFRE